jgi:hypothetical protein
VDGATDETENLDEFCDHFGGHHKTTGRTFTGGPDFFENIFQPSPGPVSVTRAGDLSTSPRYFSTSLDKASPRVVPRHRTVFYLPVCPWRI